MSRVRGEVLQDDLTDHQFMFRRNNAKEIRANPSRGDGTHQHVGIEEHPHDTSRNTSSSVRYPAASANGATRRRISSNWSSAN